MPPPALSIVVPAFNEEARIAKTIAAVIGEIDRLAVTGELLVVDDGSTDRTASIVETASAADARVRLIRAAHAGKGATVRRGMRAAHGERRFLADADLSTPIAEITRFLDAMERTGADLVIGSREADGAARLGEPWSRHIIGRAFNWAVKLLVLSGINDTQCGFKLFSARAADTLFASQRLDGFGFDVEILFLARRAGFDIREIPVTWVYARDSKVGVASGARGFVDILAVRLNQLRGLYPIRK
jgi:glycosyltransferase involved in cell wall biosynthesis